MFLFFVYSQITITIKFKLRKLAKMGDKDPSALEQFYSAIKLLSINSDTRMLLNISERGHDHSVDFGHGEYLPSSKMTG